MASTRVTSAWLPISSDCNRLGIVVLLVATDWIKRAVGAVPIQMKSCLPGKRAEGRRKCMLCTQVHCSFIFTFCQICCDILNKKANPFHTQNESIIIFHISS